MINKLVNFSIAMAVLILLLFTVFVYPNCTYLTLERALENVSLKSEKTIFTGQFILNHYNYNAQTSKKELSKLASSMALYKTVIKNSTNPFGPTVQLKGYLSSGSVVLLRLDCCSYNSLDGQFKKDNKLHFEVHSQGLSDVDKVFLRKMKKLAVQSRKDLLISTCLISSIHGKLEDELKRKIEKNIFCSVGAKEKQGFSYQQMNTWIGYTPFIFSNLFTGREKANFQLVIRYDKMKNKTDILLGSPIVDIDY